MGQSTTHNITRKDCTGQLFSNMRKAVIRKMGSNIQGKRQIGSQEELKKTKAVLRRVGVTLAGKVFCNKRNLSRENGIEVSFWLPVPYPRTGGRSKENYKAHTKD